MAEITRPAPHTFVGIPTCLPKLLVTHVGPQTEADDNMRCDQPAINISFKHILEVDIFKWSVISSKS